MKIEKYLTITLSEWRLWLGAGIGIMFTLGLDKTVTLLYAQILDRYNQTEVTFTSAIFSAKVFIQFASGPLVTLFCKRFGNCTGVAVGTLLYSTAFIAMGLSPSIEYLLATFSLMAGLGTGMIIVSSYIMASEGNTKTKGIRFGLIAMMGSVGAVFYPLFLSNVFNNYDYRSAMIILCAVNCNIFISVFLFYGHKSYKKQLQRLKQTKANVTRSNPEKLTITIKSKPTLLHQRRSNLYYLIAPKFSMFCLFVGATFLFAYMTHVVHFLKICQETLDSQCDVKNILLVGAVADFCFRVPLGAMFDYLRTPHRCMVAYLITCFFYGLFLICIGLANNTVSMYAAYIGAVLGAAVCYSQVIPIVMVLIPLSAVSQGIGTLRVFQGVGSLLGPPLTGLAADTKGEFPIVMFIASGVICGGTAIYSLIYLLFSLHEKRKNAHLEEK